MISLFMWGTHHQKSKTTQQAYSMVENKQFWELNAKNFYYYGSIVETKLKR